MKQLFRFNIGEADALQLVPFSPLSPFLCFLGQGRRGQIKYLRKNLDVVKKSIRQNVYNQYWQNFYFSRKTGHYTIPEFQIINVLFNLLLYKYQGSLEQSFLYNVVDGLFYKCHKIRLNCGGSFIDSPRWFFFLKSYNKSLVNMNI